MSVRLPITEHMARTAALMAALALAALASPAVAGAAQPIEGTWNYLGGQVLVEPASGAAGRFDGTVVVATRFGSCVHPVGERMWAIAGGGASYSGTHQWFDANSCTGTQPGAATWTVRETGDRFLLELCTAQPGEGTPVRGSSTTSCNTLDRAKPPGGSPTSAPGTPSERPSPAREGALACSGPACMVVPSAARGAGCLRRGTFTHRFAIRLRRSERRSTRLLAARFTLDWKPNGVDRRPPFQARVRGSKLTPGSHLLIADVRLRRAGGGATRHRRLAVRFDGCR